MPRILFTFQDSGSEFQVNTYTTGNQYDPKVADLPGGRFVVVWESRGGQDGDDIGVFGRIFTTKP